MAPPILLDVEAPAAALGVPGALALTVNRNFGDFLECNYYSRSGLANVPFAHTALYDFRSNDQVANFLRTILDPIYFDFVAISRSPHFRPGSLGGPPPRNAVPVFPQ